MTLYTMGRGPDEYELAEDDEIIDAALVIANRRLGERWRDGPSIALSADKASPSSVSTLPAPAVAGARKIEITGRGSMDQDSGGAASAPRRGYAVVRTQTWQIAPGDAEDEAHAMEIAEGTAPDDDCMEVEEA